MYEWSNGRTVDFNQDLVKPMITALQHRYQLVFDTQVLTVVSGLMKAMTDSLDQLRDNVAKLKLDEGSSHLLNRQITSQTQRLKKIEKDMNSRITSLRKDAHRDLPKSVQSAMVPTYNQVAGEWGKGMFDRMKEKMLVGVHNTKTTMFSTALENVKKLVEQDLKKVLQCLRTATDQMFRTINSDARNFSGYAQERPTDAKDDRKLKIELLKLLVQNDEALKEIAEKCEGDSNGIKKDVKAEDDDSEDDDSEVDGSEDDDLEDEEMEDGKAKRGKVESVKVEEE